MFAVFIVGATAWAFASRESSESKLPAVDPVGALQKLHSQRDANERVEELNAIATQVEALAVSPKAGDAVRMIVSALDEQRAALDSWQTQGLPTHLQADPRVQRSSQLLRSAYGQLMSSYPEETKHNKEAFFDHLCTLDFI